MGGQLLPGSTAATARPAGADRIAELGRALIKRDELGAADPHPLRRHLRTQVRRRGGYRFLGLYRVHQDREESSANNNRTIWRALYLGFKLRAGPLSHN